MKRVMSAVIFIIGCSFCAFSQNIHYRATEGQIKIYVMPFNITFMDHDIGEPEGYLNGNFVRANGMYNIHTTETTCIKHLKELFFEPTTERNTFPEPKTFTRTFEYKKKHFEPDIVIDFIECERAVNTVEIDRSGFFRINSSEIYSPEKEVINFLENLLPSDIVWFEEIKK